MKMKKGDLTLNTIVLAALVLIVLVVLWAIFTGRMGDWSQRLTEITRDKTCEEAGGKETPGTDCGEDMNLLFGKFTNIDATESCCKPRGKCTGPDECNNFKSKETCPTSCKWEEPQK